MSIQVVSTADPQVTEAQKSEAPAAPVEDTKSASAPSEQDEISEESETSEIEEESQAADDSEAEDETSEDQKKPKKENGFKKRVDKLNKRLTESQRELEYWKQQAMKSGAKQEPQQTETPKVEATSDGRPDPNDYETQADYVEALTDWKIEQREKAKEAKAKEAEVKTEYQKMNESYGQRLQKFIEAKPEFQEMIKEFVEDYGSVPLSQSLELEIKTSEHGPAIFHELLKNPDELWRLNKLGQNAIAKEIGKLEARLEKSSEPSKEPKPIKPKAPAPIAPVGTKSGTVKKTIYDPNLSQREYEELRAKEARRV